ncbi:hypothetical protein [Halogranum amylolyticum]|nr:hypothetical protein [Halogranum amylolyticum]
MEKRSGCIPLQFSFDRLLSSDERSPIGVDAAGTRIVTTQR